MWDHKSSGKKENPINSIQFRKCAPQLEIYTFLLVFYFPKLTSRYHAWFKKTSGKLSSAPKLSSLPPTNESFTQNVLRGHGQCAIWLSTPYPDPPAMDETLFGFKKDVINESLVPVTLPDNVPALPPEVQKLMACGCSADEPCSKGACSCKTLKLGCTEFCKCYGQCHNMYMSHITGEDYYNDIIDCDDDS